MIWFWIGFFALVAALLALDLGVLHRRNEEQSFSSALKWTIVWVLIGLSFSGVVYLIYDNHWMGARLCDEHGNVLPGGDAVMTYVSAYLLEEALSVDNIFVMSLLFRSFRVPAKYQHRVLFWGILGAVVFRVALLGGGVFLAKRFTWIFYVFGGYLVYAGGKLFFGGEDDEDENVLEKSFAVRILRRFVRIVDGEHGGKFMITERGRRALTTLAVCLIVIELSDIVFALDSIPAVLAVSQETFIVVTSNIFAILGLRSIYFVLAGAMAKFEYLKIALAVLLILIGTKMILHDVVEISDAVSLVAIAGIISAGVIASIIASRKREAAASATDLPRAE
ncbi:MAG TPA: TerC/Alx family metal homeostasis membrane protein [Kofleriaceae bacterium]|jgi:tellurite resistance protein TerC|nr:TerC/Alx family metal homeostasis membrane protein [Kofleriaceae bacterium]